MLEVQPVPSHVPRALVVDFDFYHMPGGDDDVHQAWKRLHRGPDIFWTPRNGGHWVVTRGEDILATQRDPEIFSFSQIVVPAESKPFKLIPLELDPPEHTPYRMLINTLFTPKNIERLEPDIRTLTVALIEEFRARGECEFVGEFAKQLPIVMFLRLMGLPLEDRPMLLAWTEASVRASEPEDRVQSFRNVYDYIDTWIARRRAAPGDDFVSKIVHATIEGRPLTHLELQQILSILLFGGLDTVASAMGFIARFLAESPQHRRQLAENPALISDALEELLRRFGVSTTGRVIAKDVVYKGIAMRKGDRMHVFNGLYGMDERIFPDPMTVDFGRKRPIHAAFGSGVHRCPGSFLARLELKVFLEEWLKRIPDFHIKPGKHAITASGMVNAVLDLPLAWAA